MVTDCIFVKSDPGCLNHAAYRVACDLAIPVIVRTMALFRAAVAAARSLATWKPTLPDGAREQIAQLEYLPLEALVLAPIEAWVNMLGPIA